MYCLTYKDGAVTPGIHISKSATDRDLVFLGQKGPKCMCSLIFLDKNPEKKPDINENNLISLAYPVKRNLYLKGGRMVEKVMLKKAFPSATKILLRINTSTSSTKMVNGRWVKLEGWPEVWAKSNGFSNGQRSADDLITMDDCDVILIIPAGGEYDKSVIVNDKGVISQYTEKEYQEIVKEKRAIKLQFDKKDKELWEGPDEDEIEEVESEGLVNEDNKTREIVIHSEEEIVSVDITK